MVVDSQSLSNKMENFVLFFLIGVAIFVTIAHEVDTKCVEDQQQLLLNFKSRLFFIPTYSAKLISWNASTDCCSWLGITCSANGSVLALDISSEHVSGSLDNSSSLFDLQTLQSLNLDNNKFGSGANQLIPSAIGKLSNLRRLILSHNQFSGEIPVEIFKLKRLVILDISFNGYESVLINPNIHMLVGNVTELKELYLDYTRLSDVTDWYQIISSFLPNLRVLSLSNCDLSVPFHKSLANLQSLSVINLGGNYILGPVPRFFANFSNLKVLDLSDCGLHGTFPTEIFQLPSLQSIDLKGNYKLQGSLPEFSDNGSLRSIVLGGVNFSGMLPHSIGKLNMLSTFFISGCSFSGSIPMSMANLTQLVDLHVSRNSFEGSVPSFSKAKSLEVIDFSWNQLTGNIKCTQWENLTNLHRLNLNNNMLNGNIPPSLFSLPMLSNLQLSNNQFSGQFPEVYNVSSNYLTMLDLSSNNLEGPIPMSISNIRGLKDLRLSSNYFNGTFFPDGLPQLVSLSYLDLSHNNLFLGHKATNFSYSSFPKLHLLNLASNKLSTFPDFLRNQSELTSLDLSDNQIHGKVPSWIWRLSNIYGLNLCCNSLETLEGPTNVSDLKWLDLHSNQFYGKIPHFSNLPFYLDYSRNYFNSSIPTSIGDMLHYTVYFSVSSNNLTGTIPASICNSKSLEILDLSDNSLSGRPPQCLTKLSTLAILNLRRNRLTDIDLLSQNCNLETLDISGNQIRGQFLKSLVNCTKLEVLNLANNQITGPFPCFLKYTSTLRVLVMRSNKFYGNIGCLESNVSWPMLQIIDLAHNDFSGEVPGRALITWQAMMDSPLELIHLQFTDSSSRVYYQDEITVTIKGLELELVKILTIYTSIDLSCNKFTGSIPEEIGELKSLLVLNLSNNAFTGAIPSSLSYLSQLESLDLAQNILSGEIPPQLNKLTFLAVLNLSNNQLVGRIPSSNQFSTFSKQSYEGNKGLFGPPLTADNTTVLLPPTSQISHPNSGEEIDWETIISVEIGFTCGFGIAVGSLLFCKKWRTWYYRTMYSFIMKIFPQLEHSFGPHRRHVRINQRWRL